VRGTGEASEPHRDFAAWPAARDDRVGVERRLVLESHRSKLAIRGVAESSDSSRCAAQAPGFESLGAHNLGWGERGGRSEAQEPRRRPKAGGHGGPDRADRGAGGAEGLEGVELQFIQTPQSPIDCIYAGRKLFDLFLLTLQIVPLLSGVRRRVRPARYVSRETWRRRG
jgi:hypothetical protein